MDMLRISGLEKRFGDKQVRKGLELTVPEHSISASWAKTAREKPPP